MRPLPFLCCRGHRVPHLELGRGPTAWAEGPSRICATFELERAKVILVGFHSCQNHGVFTPAGSNIHGHFQTADDRKSGHVQKLQIGTNAVLTFPLLYLSKQVRLNTSVVFDQALSVCSALVSQRRP